MEEHIREYFSEFSDSCPKGNFHRVINLEEMKELDWAGVQKLFGKLPKGWYELTRLSREDRVEFTRDYWMAKLPFHPHLPEYLENFFSSVEDISVFLTQRTLDDPFKVQMVYALSGSEGFYKGEVPAAEEQILDLQKLFPDVILPNDYLVFLRIHNGFSKATDCTGIIGANMMKEAYNTFQQLLENSPQVKTSSGKIVDPSTLIPFYESFGLPFYQCFWSEWHPEDEMGNVYYSGTEHIISDTEPRGESMPEFLAFPTFSDWLMFYLERIE